MFGHNTCLFPIRSALAFLTCARFAVFSTILAMGDDELGLGELGRELINIDAPVKVSAHFHRCVDDWMGGGGIVRELSRGRAA